MTTRSSCLLLLAVLLLLGVSDAARGQDRQALRRGAAAPATTDPSVEPIERLTRFRSLDRLPLWSAPLASAILPGLGQARLGNDRFVGYMATEAFLILRYMKNQGEFRENARGYRDIARDIARRGFVPNPPDTIFQYYEKMEQFLESGVFTLASSGPTVPERDPGTYNGDIWQLARRQFGVSDDPGEVGSVRYQSALTFYESRAVRQPYRWSWRNAQLEKDLFRRSIERSNNAARRATLDLSAIIANHLLSAVDAFAVLRLRQLADGRMGLTAAIALP